MTHCETQAELARHATARAHIVPDTPQFTANIARQPLARHQQMLLICTYALHTLAWRLRAKHPPLCLITPHPPHKDASMAPT